MIERDDYFELNCLLCSGGKDNNAVPVARIIDKLDSYLNANNTSDAFRLLYYWINEARAVDDKRGELSLINELVGATRINGRYEDCAAATERALVLINELSLGDTVSGGTVLLNCATAMKAIGNAKDSIPIFEQVHAIYKQYLSPNDARLGGLYNNMALALTDLKRFDKAEEAFLSAIRITEQARDGQTETAVSYINLAHMYEECGKEDAIGECIDRALILLQTPDLPHDGHYAFVLSKCAPSFAYFGWTEEAKLFEEEAKTIYARN